jgi:hypothetical protein
LPRTRHRREGLSQEGNAEFVLTAPLIKAALAGLAGIGLARIGLANRVIRLSRA